MTEIRVLMPAFSATRRTGRLARWLVDEGARVAEGDVIAEIASEHGTLEVEAEHDGLLHRILVPAGAQPVEADTPIAMLLPDRADVPSPDGAATVAAPAAADRLPRLVTPAADVARDTSSFSANSHGASSFSASLEAEPARTGSRTSPQRGASTTLREALRDALAGEMERDGEVLLLGEGVAQRNGSFAICEGLLDRFGPRRVIEIAGGPAAAIGLGVGAACAGLRPVVQVSSLAAALSALDPIVHVAAKAATISGGAVKVPLVIRGPNGATAQAGARLSQCVASWLAHVPGLKVVAPTTPADAAGLLRSAIRDDGPVVMLESEEHYSTAGPAPTCTDALVPIGAAAIARAGGDVTIVAYGRGVAHALAAAEQLSFDAISAEVIDLRTLRPLDVDGVVRSVARTGRLVTVEEGWPVASVGAYIVAAVSERAFASLRAAPRCIAGADVAMPYAESLQRLALPDAEGVVRVVQEVCRERT